MLNLLAKIDLQKRSIFAQNVVLRRKARNWTQGELAEKAGVATNVVKNFEHDKSEGRPSTRRAVAGALGCTVSDLFRDPKSIIPFTGHPDGLTHEQIHGELAQVQGPKLVGQMTGDELVATISQIPKINEDESELLQQYRNDDDFKELFGIYRQLNDDRRRNVLVTLRKLVGDTTKIGTRAVRQRR